MKKYPLAPLAFCVIGGAALTACIFVVAQQPHPPAHRAPFETNIVKATLKNTDYRRVLYTGTNSQLVVMSIPPGGEVGAEVHLYVEQILYFQSGTGVAILDGTTTPVGPGDVVVVPPGTEHNFINTGHVPLQITTTYAPANHIDGTVEKTKAEADANTADENFSNAVR